MPQGSRGRKGTGRASKSGNAGDQGVIGAADQLQPAARPAAEPPQTSPRPLADAAALECILANTRELKKLAMKAGFSQIALILEMAELEASEQASKLGRRGG